MARDGKNERRGGSPVQRLEWQLRADGRLNATARLAWMLTALSAKKPATMPVEMLAEKLGVTEWVIRKGLRLIVGETRLFEVTASRGYRRTSAKGFARHVRRCRRLNLTVRLAWLLVDLISGAKTGEVAVSLSAMAQELDSAPPLVSAAAQKLVELQIFCRHRDPSGKWSYGTVAIDSADFKSGLTIDEDGSTVDDIDAGSADQGQRYWQHFGRNEGRKNGRQHSATARSN